jgi:hypothetical protein
MGVSTASLRRMRRRVAGIFAAAATWVVAPGAQAQVGDHDVALAIVGELGKDASHQALVAEPLDLARRAIERAIRFRAVGDEAHAKAADGLAREWAEMARDLVRAADAETKAAAVRRKALDEQVQFERTRALVDEGIARVGRLKAELDEAQKTTGDVKPDRHAVEVHDGDPKPPKGPTKKKPPGKPGASGAAP